MNNQITITNEMAKAIHLVKETNQHVYITGKAGTGKTTLLRHIIANVGKQFIICAPTGVAAINAGGVTLHSMFGIPLGVIGPDNVSYRLPKHKAQILRKIQVLVIDEVSMVRPDVLDFVDRRLQKERGNKQPFGGVQLVMFGDLFQLPPVIPPKELDILSNFYDGCYFYNANVFDRVGFNVVELTHIFRQTDEKFINILNNIREYKPTEEDIEDLGELRSLSNSKNFETNHVHICTHRKDVEAINNKMLGEYTNTFSAEIEGDFKDANIPCDMELKLREGARVMMLINDGERRYVNGSLGTVEFVSDDELSVTLDDGETVEVEKHTWEAKEYVLNGKTVDSIVKGKCTQYPLTLAWAITIHKSQGLQFPKVVIHTKGAFCPGQIYVALSRCTSMDGVVCDSFINKKHIIADYDLLNFEKSCRRAGGYYGNLTKTMMEYEGNKGN